MDQEEQNKLTERIEKVEALLIDLGNQVSDINDQLNRQRINQGQPADYAPPGNRVEPSPPLSPPPNSNYDKPKSPVEADPDREVNQGEFWLNKIGITLLLIGLGFLFKYSIDQHWVTPFVRVSFGLVLGVVLVGIGMRKFETRKIFSQAVMGGGIAAFYITGYAAFQLYHMVPHFLAFSFMVGVTLLSYYLALYQNEPPLALVAVIGGLGTPFLLNTGSGNIPGLTLYTCVVLAGS
ncbi:MAG: DUF2339 domain-containing protein, partial [Nitrospinota bacterium]|nr:DUF2339 domain-containing protein [Nitrospinota bacterium]